jgi:hypothetical protein
MNQPARVEGLLSWRDATLSISVPDARWLDRLGDLLGLPWSRLATADAEMRVHDERSLRSFETELTFATQHDLLVWLALTITDVLAEKAGAVLVHAASLRFGTGVLLLSGPPYAGKSTLAMRARTIGLDLFGDDVVLINPDTLGASAVPRALRERVPPPTSGAPPTDPLRLGTPLTGRLDGEGCRLHPRLRGPAVILNEMPVAGVYFLRRHSGPGVRFAVPPPFEAVAMLLNHARAWGPRPLAALSRAAQLLKRCDSAIVSVGDDEVAAGLDAILARQAAPAPAGAV